MDTTHLNQAVLAIKERFEMVSCEEKSTGGTDKQMKKYYYDTDDHTSPSTSQIMLSIDAGVAQPQQKTERFEQKKSTEEEDIDVGDACNDDSEDYHTNLNENTCIQKSLSSASKTQRGLEDL